MEETRFWMGIAKPVGWVGKANAEVKERRETKKAAAGMVVQRVLMRE